MNVVDSSGWLEYFTGRPNAQYFASAIEDYEALIVPTICIFEVFKHVLRERGADNAQLAVSIMRQGSIVPLDPALAMSAAQLGLRLRLPMADSIILATAQAHNAILWTQDADFKGFEGVEYRERKS